MGLILLVVVVTFVGGVAPRADLPAPLLLVAAGVAGSYLPRYGTVEVDPELVLVGLIPPLLYAAATQTSLLEFRSNLRNIASLSVGLVIATTVAVGVFAWWVLPIPLAAKQKLMELDDPQVRLQLVHEYLRGKGVVGA